MSWYSFTLCHIRSSSTCMSVAMTCCVGTCRQAQHECSNPGVSAVSCGWSLGEVSWYSFTLCHKRSSSASMSDAMTCCARICRQAQYKFSIMVESGVKSGWSVGRVSWWSSKRAACTQGVHLRQKITCCDRTHRGADRCSMHATAA